MLANLLVEAGYPKKIGFGEAAIDALIGFLVVFAGIALLVFVVWLVGRIMNPTTNKSEPVKKPAPVVSPKPQVKQEQTDELSEETVAVITAAIMAYYERENRKCEFTVKRIRKI